MTTVRELIEGLSTLDPDLLVYVPNGRKAHGDLEFDEVSMVSEGVAIVRDYTKSLTSDTSYTSKRVVKIA